MKNVMGIIYTGAKDNYLRELTLLRAVAAMPIGARFRVIDFYVSGMVNSGMRNVGVIMQKNYHSLMDHLGSGKEWDLHGKNDGLYILPPFLTRENVGVYNGSLDALHSNMGYLRRSKQEYVLLSNSLIVYNPKFSEMYEAFLQSGAEMMTLYTKNPSMLRSENGIYLDIDENNHVTDVEINPTTPPYTNVSMEAYLMRKDLLLNLVDRGSAHGYHDFTRDVFQRMVRDAGINVHAHEYKEACFRLDSVQGYFNCNMALLDADVRRDIFAEDRPLYTKVRDELPARYMAEAKVTHSIIADGSMINGTVDHSVIFRGVRIDEGASVKNCILMQDAHIEAGAQLENCILDKQAVVKANGRLIGPSSYPIVISKNMVI